MFNYVSKKLQVQYEIYRLCYSIRNSLFTHVVCRRCLLVTPNVALAQSARVARCWRQWDGLWQCFRMEERSVGDAPRLVVYLWFGGTLCTWRMPVAEVQDRLESCGSTDQWCDWQSQWRFEADWWVVAPSDWWCSPALCCSPTSARWHWLVLP